MADFNKEKAFDVFNKILSEMGTPNAKASDVVRGIIKCQDYFKSIYDKGYNDGFKKGVNMNDEVKRITKNN